MAPQGRKKDAIWCEFLDLPHPDNSIKKLKCKHCGIEVQPLVERMKKHVEACKNKEDQVEVMDVIDVDDDMPSTSASAISRNVAQHQQKRKQASMSQYVKITRTTKDFKRDADLQCARFIFSSNSIPLNGK